MRWTVLATIPAVLAGTWNLGYQVLLKSPETVTTSLPVFESNPSSPSVLSCLLTGLIYYLPILAVSVSVAGLWSVLFAKYRHRPLDPAWFLCGWLYSLLVPASASLFHVGLGISFGVVVGLHIFGGTGKYLVNPALLGALFLHLSYPEFVNNPLPSPVVESGSSWSLLVTTGTQGESLVNYFLGVEIGLPGSTSVIASMAGCAMLIYLGTISWRIVAGAVIGLLSMSLFISIWIDSMASQIPWYWHLVLGNFVFAIVFLATDPSACPLTRPARWIFGLLIGALTILIRTLDPSAPEATLTAVLLACLATPLMDYFVVRRYWQEPSES